MPVTGHLAEGPIGRKKSTTEIIKDSQAKILAERGLGINADWILSGAESTRPPYGSANRIYIVTDATKKIFLDTGAAWVQIV